MNKINICEGTVFGRLTVIKELPTSKKRRRVLCKCSCGNYKIFDLYELTRKTQSAQSCGCLSREINRIRFAKMNHERAVNKSQEEKEYFRQRKRLRNIRHCIIERCYNPSSDSYKYYGGKGITVCDEWLNNLDDFVSWSFSNGYKDNYYIERIDNELPYCPSNCMWVTSKKQANHTSRNIYIRNKNGVVKTASEWAEIYGLSSQTIRRRFASKNRQCFIEDIIYPTKKIKFIEMLGNR